MIDILLPNTQSIQGRSIHDSDRSTGYWLENINKKVC